MKKTDIKILGIKFDREGGGRGNWQEALAKVRQRFGFWRRRQLTIEGKVLIIKSVILPLFLLLCSVFYPPRWFLLSVDREMFHFVWGGKWERLTREEMKKSPRNGGRGIPNFYLFLGAYYTALHMKYALDTKTDNKTAAMSRFWMGSYLRSLKILPTNHTVPVAFKPSAAYDFIKKFLNKHILEKETKSLTNHRLLLSLIQEREQVTPVRWIKIGEAQTVWQNVSHPALHNRHRDLAAHEILPVRAVMHSRGMATNPICPRPGCNAPESVRHTLWECSVARDLWATAGPQQFPSLPAGEVQQLDYPMIMGGVSQRKMTPAQHTQTWLTINCYKDVLWTSRNLLVGKHVMVTLHAMKQLVNNRLQEYAAHCHSDVGVGATQERSPWPRALTACRCPPSGGSSGAVV